ncbi:lipid-A-disaccharide synthase [Usitatibacter palustris]|uniref:Lipid-A-disaccharide synthase n=1 Tax=Usitatibacter palustris TaxID=2732487 RepID=A0A6M4H3K2_9PROT|nr:lipid-A-disaccharide synthase [Usitatibacter palustris]QJR14159.1 Lipid-A-disaccharide synthase [Usitatibacter palustris]
MTRVAIVAGEASGDLLGAALIRAVRSRNPDVQFYGICGPKMMAEGATTLFPMEKLAVRGYVEVLKHFREIHGIRSQLARRLLADKPDLFIGVDAPDFNLALEAKLKAAGTRTVHFVSPSIWAWRANRIHGIKRAVDRMLAIFPFEEAIYEKAGIPVSYVGHPLADTMPVNPDRTEARAQLRLPSFAVPVALLPGSRMSELEAHADLVIDTASKLAETRPDVRFFVPLATRETRDYFETRLHIKGAQELPLTILFGHARLALTAADVALVASGTATLEAALAGCPMVITYRMPKLTYWLMKRKALLPYVGLPNILAGEFLVPELLQDDATPVNLAQALGNWLDHKDAREKLRDRFADMHRSLAQGHDERLALALQPYL